ncbi:diaminopropionate ammonia-lyase [Paenibacillus validus]|uniref:diaminopropionate ammonia-lyase n=1 Tax=Paenibacillus validus TaxID=44253 RepID=UPI0012D8EC29|nr:diaminopropionate ammonia-lyase [Paenibacillus validus]
MRHELVKPSGIKFICNDARNPDANELPLWLSVNESVKALNFQKSMSGYAVTPLIALNRLAEAVGVAGIAVKDESYRLGLNAFKGLGVTYALGNVICGKLGIIIEDTTFDYLKSAEVRHKLGDLTFTTATDGNHGRAVAWVARQFGQKAVVYLPKGSAARRVEAIRETGAQAIVTEFNYDDTVQLAKEKAAENGWEIVQDTAWDGYTRIPQWIMQGYTTILGEVGEQIRHMEMPEPTHIVLQAGVGGMAGALLGYWANLYEGKHPVTLIVEPDNAACIFHSASVGDREPHQVYGSLETIMAGLACGEPNPIAWSILRDFADAYVSCPDYVAARGMRMLASPLEGDQRVISGESGAVGIGLLSLLMSEPEFSGIRSKLKLDQDSVVLFINTEGDTDPVLYRQIVWDGKYPMPQR